MSASDRSPPGSRRCPDSWPSTGPGPRSAGPPVAAARARIGRDLALVHRRDRGRRWDLPPVERRRLQAAADRAKAAVADYETRSCRAPSRQPSTAGRSAASCTTSSSACGPSTASMPTRSWRSASSSWPSTRPPGRRPPTRSTRRSTRRAVIDRIKTDHPADLRGGPRGLSRRDAPGRAAPDRPRHRERARRRADRGHRRPPSTCATSSRSRPISSRRSSTGTRPGIYIVTPSVDDDPGAMREHNWSSISNTSIHEAYPGHHLQLSVAGRHPILSRLAAQAPEFVEGWGMYSEQMMREEDFDDAPNFRLSMHTDAIWRACRIILDVRMHRGEIGVDEADRLAGRADQLRGRPTPGPRSGATPTPRPTSCRTCWARSSCCSCARTSAAGWASVQPAGLPRHPAAQRQPADQLPSPAAGR